MKIAGLMCWHFDPFKTHKYCDSLAELCAITDEVFVLDDGSNPPFDRTPYPKVKTVIRNDENGRHWNDWSNHCTLLIAAAKHGYEFVLWLDDDEAIRPLDRAILDDMVQKLKDAPCAVATRLRWLQAWDNPNQARVDGEFGNVRKPFLQRNPFSRPAIICFHNDCSTHLHSWPVQGGTQLSDDRIKIIHYSLITLGDRVRIGEKYRQHDPENKFPNILLEELNNQPIFESL